MINLGISWSDVVKLGPANVIKGRMEFITEKGCRRRRQILDLPITDKQAFATILVKAGATEPQLMAFFGGSDSKTAQQYPKAA